MKLLYATSIELPSVRANRIQILAMAEAFHRALGDSFLLGISAMKAGIDIKDYHFEVGQGRSLVLAWRYLSLMKQKGFTHIFCREEKMLGWMIFWNKIFFRLPVRFCYELHRFEHFDSFWFQRMFRGVERVVSIPHSMANILKDRGYSPECILVACDAVDLKKFDIEVTKEEARKRLGLPTDKILIVYTGSIVDWWQGVPTLFESARFFDDRYVFVIVGGKPHYVEEFKTVVGERQNVRMEGYRPHDDIPYYLKAADALVLPYSAKNEITRTYASPMKLFEYMASQRPIVASDLPSTREVISEKDAVVVEPDNAESLAEGLRSVLNDHKRAERFVVEAFKEVQRYTWDKRARAILDFIA